MWLSNSPCMCEMDPGLRSAMILYSRRELVFRDEMLTSEHHVPDLLENTETS